MRLPITLFVLLPLAFAPGASPAAECHNKEALGFSRVVEIDTTVPKRYGANGNDKSPDYVVILRDHEVILSFDDGPMPATTPLILDALDQQCTKAMFFAVGRRALAYPDILKDAAARGHAIAGHTWSHAHQLGLVSRKIAVDEIENGFSAVARAVGGPITPFFRFPYLQKSDEMLAYLKARGVAEFSVDIVSDDTVWHEREASEIVSTTMERLNHEGHGIILMHDIKPGTARILPELLRRLQAGGYNVVRVMAKTPLKTDPAYDLSVGVQVAAMERRRLDAEASVAAAGEADVRPVVAKVLAAKVATPRLKVLTVKVAAARSRAVAVITPKVIVPRVITPRVAVAKSLVVKAAFRVQPAKAKPPSQAKAKAASSSFAVTFGSLINGGN